MMKNKIIIFGLFIAMFFFVSNVHADLYLNSKVGSIYFNTTGIARASIGPGGNFTVNTSVFFVNNNLGRVGIGTTTPGATLDVRGNASVEDRNLLFFRDTGNGNGFSIGLDSNQFVFSIRNIGDPTTPLFEINRSSSQIGIGTTSPTGTVHISDSSPPINGVLLVDDDGTDATVTSGTAFRVTNDGTSNSYAIAEFSSGASNTVITNAGKVGIGTTSPIALLSLNSTLDANITLNSNSGGAADRNSWIVLYNNSIRAWDLGRTSGGTFVINRYNGTGVFQNQPFTISPAGSIDILDTLSRSAGITRLKGSTGDVVYVSATGLVGIGISAPSALLHVNITSASSVNIANNSNSLFFVNGTTGNVGIGTASPTGKLDVNGNINLSGDNGVITFSPTGSVGTVQSRLNLDLIAGYAGYQGATYSTIRFYTAGSADGKTERMRLTDVGNLGIGTKNATQKLDVRGNINASNEIYVRNGTAISPWLYNQTAVSGTGNLSGGGTQGYLPQWASGSTLNNSVISQIVSSIGIGISPSTKLHILGNTAIDASSNSGDQGDIRLTIGQYDSTARDFFIEKNTSGPYGSKIVFSGNSGADAGYLAFYSSNRDAGERMRIVGTTGFVGIGTTAPSSLLHVNITSSSSVNIANNSNSLFFVNGTTGNVGIGTTTPSTGFNLHI